MGKGRAFTAEFKSKGAGHCRLPFLSKRRWQFAPPFFKSLNPRPQRTLQLGVGRCHTGLLSNH